MPRGRARFFGRPRLEGPQWLGHPSLDTSGGAVDALNAIAADPMAAGGWYVTQFDGTEAVEDAFWAGMSTDSTVSVDVTPQFFPPSAVAPDEVMAQDYYDTLPHDDEIEDPWWANTYGFPDQVADIVPQLFPPPEPDETFAAQPFNDGDFATQVPTETEDYQAESTIDDSALAYPPPFTWINTAEGGTDGVGVTTGNSGGASGQPWDQEFTTGGTLTFAAGPASPIDTLAYHFDQTSGAVVTAAWTTFGWLPFVWTRVYVWIEQLASTPARIITFRTPTLQAAVQINATGKVAIADGVPSAIQTSNAILNLGQWYRIEAFYGTDPAGPLITARLFLDPNSTVPDEVLSGGTPTTLRINETRFGQANVAGFPFTIDLDNIGTTNVGWLGPLGVAPDAPLTGSQPLPEVGWTPADETEDYASDTTVDVTSAFFPPLVVEPIETFAAQPHYGDIQIDEQLTEDYQSSAELDTPTEWLPPPTDAEAQAAQPHYGDLPIDEVLTEDFDATSALDTPTEWPSSPTDVETQVAQPPIAPDWLPADETEDYAADSSIDVTPFFTPAVDEVQAAQPHYGDIELLPDEQTVEDWHASALDTPTEWLPPPSDAEAQGAQPPIEPNWLPAEETEDYVADSTTDVTSAIAPATDEVFGAQPTYGEAFWPDQETEDYVSDSATDVTPQLYPPEPDANLQAVQPEFSQDDYWGPEVVDESITDPTSTIDVSVNVPPPPANTDVEYQAASQLPEHDFASLIADETEDYQSRIEQDVPHLFPQPPTDVEAQVASQTLGDDIEVFWPSDTDEPYWHPAPPLDTSTEWLPPPTDVEAQAAQPLPELPSYAPDETEDYVSDSTFDVSALTPGAVAEPIETFIAQPHYGELSWPDVETDDYDATTTIDDASFLTSTVPETEFAVATALPENWIEPEETTDYVSDSTTADTSFLTSTTPDAELIAGIALPENWIDEEVTSDYDAASTIESPVAIAQEPDETFAAQACYGGEWFWEDQPTEDYANDSTIDVVSFQVAPVIPTAEHFAAQPHYGELSWPPDETEDYDAFSATEDVWFMASAPPIFPDVIGMTALKDPGVGKTGTKDSGVAETGTAGQQIAESALKDPGIGRNALRDPGIQKP